MQTTTILNMSAAEVAGALNLKPTVAQEAIATADGYLSNAVLPTYSELLAALRLRRIRLDYALKDELAAVAATKPALPPYHDSLLHHLCEVLKDHQLVSLLDEAKTRMKQGEPA